MKRKVRFIFPGRQPPQPAAPPMTWPTLAPMHPPHPLGGSYCPSCGAHWPVAWFSVVPPCNCANSGPMWGMAQNVAGSDAGRLFYAALTGGAS